MPWEAESLHDRSGSRPPWIPKPVPILGVLRRGSSLAGEGKPNKLAIDGCGSSTLLKSGCEVSGGPMKEPQIEDREACELSCHYVVARIATNFVLSDDFPGDNFPGNNICESGCPQTTSRSGGRSDWQVKV